LVADDELARIFKATTRFLVYAIDVRVGYPEIDFHEFSPATTELARWLSENGRITGWLWDSADHALAGLLLKNNYLVVRGIHAEYEAWNEWYWRDQEGAIKSWLARDRSAEPVDLDALFDEVLQLEP
jgi:hypothetical protein